MKEQFIKDAGFQHYIIARCGLNIGRIFIVTHGEDDENPFVINDVTEEAKGYTSWVNENIWILNKIQKQREEIDMPVGEQCTTPYECWYYHYCHDDSEQMSLGV